MNIPPSDLEQLRQATAARAALSRAVQRAIADTRSTTADTPPTDRTTR